MTKMRTIGLLGGMSWESTATYYRAINKGVKEKLGGLHSAKICMISVDFDEIEKLQHADDWDGAGDMLSRSAQAVEAGGADFLVICTNTMHKVAAQLAQRIQIPILHIADATAEHLKAKGLERVGLLGTKFTMEQEFYAGRLRDQHGIQVLLPESEERSIIHGVIYEELCLGNILDSSKRAFLDIIRKLHHRGAHGVILGCTEIAMLVQASDTEIPLFATTAIHTQAAVERALS